MSPADWHRVRPSVSSADCAFLEPSTLVYWPAWLQNASEEWPYITGYFKVPSQIYYVKEPLMSYITSDLLYALIDTFSVLSEINPFVNKVQWTLKKRILLLSRNYIRLSFHFHTITSSKTLNKIQSVCWRSSILRVGGRLHLSGILCEQKQPDLKHLWIENNLHAGHQTLHFLSAENFWILSSRLTIQGVS